MLLIDAIAVKVRDSQVANRPVYVAIGVDLAGERDVLGLWLGPAGGEGATQWATMGTELTNRGLADALIVCCDGLRGRCGRFGLAGVCHRAESMGAPYDSFSPELLSRTREPGAGQAKRIRAKTLRTPARALPQPRRSRSPGYAQRPEPARQPPREAKGNALAAAKGPRQLPPRA